MSGKALLFIGTTTFSSSKSATLDQEHQTVMNNKFPGNFQENPFVVSPAYFIG